MTTRAEILTHVHRPLQNLSSDPPRSSSTKSTYRVHWRELTEWQHFQSDTMDYWNVLDDNDKNAILPVQAGYWSFMESLLQRTARRFRREPHLITPFTVAYAGPHNEAISGASDDHASLETALP